ncbi:MAG TPA: YraN family protein [Chitinophagaceae bacterium]
MALHNELGRRGEKLAGEYLSALGYTILFMNWRHWRYEIDLIAVKDDILHFIEVKTRRSTRFGLPEGDVNKKKMLSMVNAAEGFMQRYPQWRRMQFDVLSICITDENVEYLLIEDVYI